MARPSFRCSRLITIVLAFVIVCAATDISTTRGATMHLDEIWIRDPNIMYHDGLYYMTGTTAGDGFLGYVSSDLEHWDPIGHIYTRNASSTWALQDFWAPEQVYKNGKFYLFFSGKTSTTNRSTGVAVATSPVGPYVDLMLAPLTPAEWMCLDGHLFRDDNGSEYFIYSYEWVDFPSGIGEFWIQPIAPNFTTLIGEKTLLFRGKDATWSGGITDGPSMLKLNGTYYLFWSSINHGYNCGYASSRQVLGPYEQSINPTITGDGGHSTWFRRGGDGELLITYHQPNHGDGIRAHIDRLCFVAGQWHLCKDLGSAIDAWPSIIPLALIGIASVVLFRRTSRPPRK